MKKKINSETKIKLIILGIYFIPTIIFVTGMIIRSKVDDEFRMNNCMVMYRDYEYCLMKEGKLNE